MKSDSSSIIIENGSQIFDRKFIRGLILGILVLLIFLDFPFLCGGHEGHGHSHDHVEEPPAFKYSKAANEKPSIRNSDQPKYKGAGKPPPVSSGLELWMKALGSTLLISAAPLVILFLVPLDNTKEKEPRLKVLLSFASGGLLGDAFLHLIPHALASIAENSGHTHSHSHSHSHSHGHGEGEESTGHDMSVGLWVLSGILTFLLVEKFVRLVKGGHGHSHILSSDSKSSVVDNSTKKKSKKKNSDEESDGESDKKKGKKENSVQTPVTHEGK